MLNPIEITMSTNDVQELIEGQKALQKSHDVLSTHILKLTTLISGNELDRDDKGMIGRLADVEEDISQLKDSNKKIKWTFAGAMIAGSVLVTIVQLVFKAFFK